MVKITTTQVLVPDPLGQALGTIAEPFPVATCTQFTAPGTQTVYAMAVYIPAAQTLTGLKLRLSVGAAGTSPTTARFGLMDNTGKVLVLSGNVNAAAQWPSIVAAFPFTAQYVTLYSGVYFAGFVVNGTWGTTQPTPAATVGTGAFQGPDGANPPVAIQWIGQTDLPAVGQSINLSGTGRIYWVGVY